MSQVVWGARPGSGPHHILLSFSAPICGLGHTTSENGYAAWTTCYGKGDAGLCAQVFSFQLHRVSPLLVAIFKGH